MNNQENDQQHQHQEDGQEEAEEEQEKEAEKEQEKPEAAEDQEKLEAAEDQEKLEESEEEEKLEEAENHIMQSSSSTNSQSPPFGSPQLSTIASNHQAYSLHHPQAFKPPKPSSPPPSGAAVKGDTNIGISKPQDGGVADGKNDQESGGGGERRLRTNLSILRRVRRENMKRRALLGFRISGALFSLVSFSIMAADKNQGWVLDSFHHYKEFRYCMAVNVLGFVYSSLQGYDVAYSLAIGKHAVRTQLRCFLDFSIDQILTYLLLSASSSAAFRVEDWESNWGKDEFPTMAKASVALSFLAFVAFAFCSLVSGYTLFTPNSK